MSLLDTLLEKANDLVEDKSEEWFDKLLAEGRDLATAPDLEDVAYSEEEEDETVVAARAAGNEALDLLEENKQPFLRLANLGFAKLIAHWEDDDEAEARRYYLTKQATYAERRAAMHAGGDAAAKDRDERDEAWDAVAGVLKQVGTLGLKFLVNLAAKSVGLPITL